MAAEHDAARGRREELLNAGRAAAEVERLVGPLEAPHLVTLRGGGVSAPPYDRLNLGVSVGDDPAAVAENRRRAAAAIGVAPERVATVAQVHGGTVLEAGPDTLGRPADGLVSADPTWALAVGAADCLPVLMHDAVTGAVAAVHAGWRGTAAGVVGEAVRLMGARYGTRPADLRAWFGPTVRGACYQVGPEVVEALEASLAAVGASAPGAALADPDVPGRARVDVAAYARAQLVALGVPPAAVSDAGVCTHCDPRCFSHRRDRGRTGRSWAMIRAAP